MTRPIPVPDPATEPYWAGVRESRLRLPFCTSCDKFHFYPRSFCPHCGAASIEWREASGRGHVHSFTVVYRPPSPAFAAHVPYVVGIVSLEEGPQMMTNVVGIAPDAVRIGMPVKVAFETREEGVVIPVFEVVPTAAATGGPGGL